MSDSSTDKVRQLEAEVNRLQGEVDHWKRVARRIHEENSLLRWELQQPKERKGKDQ